MAQKQQGYRPFVSPVVRKMVRLSHQFGKVGVCNICGNSGEDIVLGVCTSCSNPKSRNTQVAPRRR